MRGVSLIYRALAAWALILPIVAYAQPRPRPVSREWELNFRHSDPRRVSVVVPGHAKPIVYWYILYEVENQTGRDLEFLPSFRIVTDTLRVVRSEIGVSPEAFKAIFRRGGDPLLLEPTRMLGVIRQGKDRSKHGVAIWPDFDPSAKAFTVYVGGLSGEQTWVRNPAFDKKKAESRANPRRFLLRKTLSIRYRLPGGTDARPRAVPERLDQHARWVMR